MKRLIQLVLTIAGVYAGFVIVFDHLIGQVIPSSLLTMYMFFVCAAVFMVFTFNEESFQELMAPIKSLVEDPSRKMMRNVVFLLLPLAVGYYGYTKATLSFEAPVELRTIHPAPPASVKVFGKRFNLLTLVNPYRKIEKEDPEKFAQLVKEGGDVYIQNCQYCHGDKLDGKGPYAQGLNPVPLNFQDVGTIAQLQEGYLFWRISTGGPGLPDEATPWLSAMPVWQNFLSEDEVWKVILYLYDYTGYRPRSWEKSE